MLSNWAYNMGNSRNNFTLVPFYFKPDHCVFDNFDYQTRSTFRRQFRFNFCVSNTYYLKNPYKIPKIQYLNTNCFGGYRL